MPSSLSLREREKRVPGKNREGGERRSVSRILFLLVTEGGNGHSSRHTVTAALKRPTWRERVGLLLPVRRASSYLVLLRVGFTQRPSSLRALVSSYLTFSPLPARQTETRDRDREKSLQFSVSTLCLYPLRRRSLFCDTFPASRRPA